MTATLGTTAAPVPLAPPPRRSRRVAGRAIRRWAWRLLRREWRQQVLILSLICIAVATTTVGLGLVENVQGSDQAVMGTASTRIDISSPGRRLGAIVTAARTALGTVEAIEHENVPVPGSVTPVDVRAQDPHGVYGAAMLRLVSGAYPRGRGQVALTSSVAALFHLRTGGTWTVDGRALRVVGLVENPKNLQDAFALVAPRQLPSPSVLTILTSAAESAVQKFRLPNVSVSIESDGTNAAAQQRSQALAVLLLATIGLSFIGLLAVAGFTVMAGRRVRALGMIGAIGATDRQVRRVMTANGAAIGIVGGVSGVLLGLVVWFALRPAFDQLVGHRIDPWAIPWWAVLAGAVLAVLTASAAAWWPARAAARVPIVAALSGRPSAPRPAHRFALLGVVVAAIGFVLLVLASERHTAFFVITGIIATTAGVLLLAPLGIRALAATAGRTPVAVRLSLRDLARYQARSAAALAAVSLAIGVAATIAITASAQQAADHTLSDGNLPTNQLIVWLNGNPNNPAGPGGDVSAVGNGSTASSGPSTAAIALARRTAVAVASAVHAQHTVPLEAAADTTTALPAGTPLGANQGVLLRPVSEGGQHGWNFVTVVYVASPALLHFYGLAAGQLPSSADIVSSRTDLAGAELGTGWDGPLGGAAKARVVAGLPHYSSAPNTLITPAAAAAHHLTAQPVGWLVQTSGALTSSQLSTARQLAAAAGITIESRAAPSHTLQQLREYATGIGALVALGVLAMTVGLMRSETANDLRTLAAAGAGGATRRTLTATTAAALALLGAALGIVAAYVGRIAWNWHSLSYLNHPPYLELALLLVGLPAVAFAGGWVFGRPPAAIARRPLD